MLYSSPEIYLGDNTSQVLINLYSGQRISIQTIHRQQTYLMSEKSPMPSDLLVLCLFFFFLYKSDLVWVQKTVTNGKNLPKNEVTDWHGEGTPTEGNYWDLAEQSSKWVWGSSARYPKNQHCTQFPQVNLKAHSQCNSHVNEHNKCGRQIVEGIDKFYAEHWLGERKSVEAHRNRSMHSKWFPYFILFMGNSSQSQDDTSHVAFRGITQRINCDPVYMTKRTLRSYFIFTHKPDSRD